MLLIVASRDDWAAQSLADRWGKLDAHVLTTHDLSRPGWTVRFGAPDDGTAIVGGRRVGMGEVRGVLVRLSAVTARELPFVVPEDRDYAAAEMTAFLRCWLTGLRCPVLNRPSPQSLSGPGWGPAQWVHVAAGLGIPVRSFRQRAALGEDFPIEPPYTVQDAVTITVIGSRSFGECSGGLADQARALAAAAGVEWLAVRFAGRDPGATFLDVDPAPGVESEDQADALAACLLGSALSC
jgi:hypothetical protein